MKILILLAQFESFVIIEPLDFGSGEAESVSFLLVNFASLTRIDQFSDSARPVWPIINP